MSALPVAVDNDFVSTTEDLTTLQGGRTGTRHLFYCGCSVEYTHIVAQSMVRYECHGDDVCVDN